MEVTASMSMPIIRDNVLWGLVACQHHAGAMPISFEKRMVCGSLAQLMSIQLEAKEDSENYQYRVHLQSLQSRFMEKLALKGDFLGANTVLDSSILDLVNASGAALCMNGKIQQIGDTFSVPETKELVIWLQGQIQSDLFSTNSLLDSGYSGSGASGISGLLAITLSNDKRNMLLWFRNELVHSLNWAGNPNKLVEYDQEGRSFLHPRKSFEAWKEIVHGHCEPWKSPEILAALDIRSSLIRVCH